MMICINILKSIYRLGLKSVSINWLKTLYVNFTLLQFKYAIKCPIVVYHRVEVHIRKSKMILTCPPHFGTITWGKQSDWMLSSKEQSLILVLNSEIRIGSNCTFGPGCTLRVQNAKIEIGKNAGFGGGSKILCFHCIKIGDNLACGFESLFYDSNSHYIMQSDGKIPYLHGNIEVGDNVWIGNNATIFRNAVIPSNSIVAQRAFVNKDFSDNSFSILLAGIPAKVKKCKIKFIDDRFNKDLTSKLDSYYLANSNALYINKNEI